MTFDIVGLRSAPTGGHSITAPDYWRVTQYLALLAGVALVATLFLQPALGLNIMWNVLIPLAPALIVVAPGLWRNICPMATFSLLPRRFSISRQRMLPGNLAVALTASGFAALLLIIPLRHLSLNTEGPATALMLLLSALLAFSLGMTYEWRSGWCNSLCPIHPVEKLYGQAPSITLANARCDECHKCTKPCPDSTRSMSPTVTGPMLIEKTTGHVMTGGFAGFVWGWYRVPDFVGSVGASDIAAAYAWPFGGALVSLAIYCAAHQWAYRSSDSRRLLVRLFAAAAVSIYYWYRIPALTGFGPYADTGMLLDLSRTWPLLPWVSRAVTTSFFVWFFLLRKNTSASWLERPVMNSQLLLRPQSACRIKRRKTGEFKQ